MTGSSTPHRAKDSATSYYRSGERMRSRNVSDRVLFHTLDVPAPPARLVADWQRDIQQRLGLEAGDVESLPLPRARTRWPDYRHCVQAMTEWTRTLGLGEVLASSEVALMACRGARYHHDGAQYGGAAFCNLSSAKTKVWTCISRPSVCASRWSGARWWCSIPASRTPSSHAVAVALTPRISRRSAIAIWCF